MTIPFSVQLLHKRVRVVLYRRQRGGPWYARFWLRNTQYALSSGQHTEPAAREWAKAKVEELAGATSETLTLRQAIDYVVAERWPTEESHGSHYHVSKLMLNKFAAHAGEHVNLKALSFESAVQMVQTYVDQRKKDQKSAQTVVSEQRVISRLFSFLIQRRKLTAWYANPAAKKFLELPAVKHVPRPPVTPTELKTLLRHARGKGAWPAVVLSLSTGMRGIGTTRIMRDDINLERRTIRVTEKSKTREVPLSRWACAELRAWMAKHKGERLLSCSKNTLFNYVRRIREKHGLRKEVTLQGCRRTFISLLMDQGVSAQMVASIAGNSVPVIERHYHDLRTMKSHGVIEKLDFGKMLQKTKNAGGRSRTRSTKRR